MNSDLRRGSYADLPSMLREDGDESDTNSNYELEEDNPGETGSADQQKRPNSASYTNTTRPTVPVENVELS